MALWNADLTTQDGAQGAAANGAYAAFVAAALTAVGTVLAVATTDSSDGLDRLERYSAFAGYALELAVFLGAGLRLRIGRGVVWSALAVAMMALEILMKLITFTGIPGIVINAILLIVLVNGLRGAIALRKGFAEDVAGVFE